MSEKLRGVTQLILTFFLVFFSEGITANSIIVGYVGQILSNWPSPPPPPSIYEQPSKEPS